MPARDLYEVLQVHHSAEPKVIQTAYRRLAKIYHPDVNPDPAAAPHMKEINLAYELLSDPVRRVQYDRGRGVQAGSTDRPTQRKRKPARTDASPPFRSGPERSSYRRGWDPWPHVRAVLSWPYGLFVAIKVCLLLLSVASHTPASARVETATPIAYANPGQHERAIQDYDEAILLDPQDAIAYNNRGLAYTYLGQHERAIQDYDEAIHLDPLDTIAYFNRGFAYNNLGQHERAIQDYDEAIRLDPQDAIAYNNRGLAYAFLGQYERAILDHNEAIRLDPQNAIAYFNRGFAYTLLGQYERAIQDYDEAIHLDPQYAQAYYIRGLVYEELGKSTEAELDIAKAKELGYDP